MATTLQPRNNLGGGGQGGPINSGPVPKPTPLNMGPPLQRPISAPGPGPMRQNNINPTSMPKVQGDSNGVTVTSDGQTHKIDASGLSKSAIESFVKDTYPSFTHADRIALAGKIFQTASTQTISMDCGGSNTTIQYNPNDPEDKERARQEKIACKKANDKVDQEANARIKQHEYNRRQGKLSGLSPALGGHVLPGIVNHFVSAFTVGNGTAKTWFYLLAYVIVLVGFVLAMWGIMTKGAKKYSAYKSVFFGLYVGSFLGILIEMIFFRPQVRNGYLESNYGGLFLIIVFIGMSLIMGWQGIYRMLKEQDDE